jgi:hypothetical protein
MTAAEKKLMEQLDAMKELVKKLQSEAAAGAAGGGGGNSSAEMDEMRRQLEAAKANVTSEDPEAAKQRAIEDEMKLQEAYHQKRGVHMYYFEKDTAEPYFLNLDEDPFRSGRFMLVFQAPVTTIGANGDVKPQSFKIVPDHCRVLKGDDGAVSLEGGEGAVYRNGAPVGNGETVVLAPYDRIVVADLLYVFHHPGRDPEGVDPPTADAAVQEVAQAIRDASASDMSPAMRELEAKMQQVGLSWRLVAARHAQPHTP